MNAVLSCVEGKLLKHTLDWFVPWLCHRLSVWPWARCAIQQDRGGRWAADQSCGWRQPHHSQINTGYSPTHLETPRADPTLTGAALLWEKIFNLNADSRLSLMTVQKGKTAMESRPEKQPEKIPDGEQSQLRRHCHLHHRAGRDVWLTSHFPAYKHSDHISCAVALEMSHTVSVHPRTSHNFCGTDICKMEKALPSCWRKSN